MLIYHKEEDRLMVTEVVSSALNTEKRTFEKKIENTPPMHQPFIRKMMEKADTIFVTGNTSAVGNGIFLDNLFTEHTKIKSSHPAIFSPPNPDFKPGIKAVEDKFRKQWVDYADGLEEDRENALKSGEGYIMSIEEIDYLADKKRTELFKERKIEKSKLKSYKEMGIIVEPTKIENYLSQKESETIIDKVKSKVTYEDNVEIQIESSQEMKDTIQLEKPRKVNIIKP